MPSFVFDDFARTTLSAATSIGDQSPVSNAQIDLVIEYLKSPGSGPDSVTSYADFVAGRMQVHPPKLPEGMDYIAFSGQDRAGISNFRNAATYSDDIARSGGIIGDTPWGTYIEDVDSNPSQHPDFVAIRDKLQRFMTAQGVQPRGDHAGALRDMMWNAGSPAFLENAIATGKPLVAFVEGAPGNRGFSNFELTTALEHPDVRINGYPVSAFGPEPLAFVSKSAAEYQALERSLAEAASVNSGQPVTVAEVRLKLKPIDGYDAVDQVLFDRPLHEFKSFNLTEMAATRADWHAARASLGTSPRLHAEVPGHTPHAATPRGGARAPPPSGAAGIAEVAAESAPHGVHAGMSPGMKVAGVAGVALLAQDFATSGHKWVELSSQGNAAGADSTAAHFVGRNLGGALGGFVAGASVGLTTGSWTGPGALVIGVGGGVLGAHLGEEWANQKDMKAIYVQMDPMGRTWTRSPTDEEGRWLRAAHQQQVQSAELGAGVELPPVQTAQGEDVTFRADYVATGTLERQLNWQAAKASYELGLAHLPPPQDPYRLNARAEQGTPPAPFETGRVFVRDPTSRQWELQITQMLDGRAPTTRHEPVSAEQAQALDAQSRAVIAQNAANTPAAVAARYMVAHAEGRWSDFGDANNPSVPAAIQDAQGRSGTLQASNGHTYTRQDDGQWRDDGLVFSGTADGNLSDELEVTWQSQQIGVAGLGNMAEQVKATVQLAPEGVRGQVEALYARHGIERSEAQLAATAAAVEQGLADNGRQGDLVLELIPDPRTHAPSADSAIAAFGDAGGNRMVLTATTTMEDVARVQASLQHTAALQGNVADEVPIQNAPELRIEALSPDAWDARQQALREANRQGASTEEAAQLAALAAMRADGRDVAEARVPELVENESSTNNEPPPSQLSPHLAAAAIAASVERTTVEEQSTAQREPQTAQGAEQGAREHVEEQRAKEAFARTAEEEEARREASVAEPQAHTAPTSPDIAATPIQPVPEPEPVARPPLEVPDLAATVAASEAKVEQQVIPEAVPETVIRVDASQPEIGVQAETSERPSMEDAASTQHPLRDEVSLDEPVTEAPPRDVVEEVVVAESLDAVPLKEPANDVIANQAVPEQQPEPEPEFAVARVAQPADEQDPWTPLNPEHPDHALYQQIREGVAKLDKAHGRSYDQTSERLTGSLMVLAKSNGLGSVDHVVLSQPTESQPGGQNVFVVQGELDNPGHQRAGMPTAQAVKTPFEESLEQFDAVAFEQEQRAAQLATQQQEEDQRVQQEMQVAAASMGY
ncbi:XVIPCD domain-containing protein [Stenotrophomonas sp. NPDC077464]|uniref:XVIPCD domain-containing protein n=1 Tax=unclassified Stenotrophomonas TaxID=196198 RepID=UPI0037D8C435